MGQAAVCPPCIAPFPIVAVFGRLRSPALDLHECEHRVNSTLLLAALSVPGIVFLCLFGAGAAMLVVIWLRHRHHQRKAAQLLADFQQQVVAYSDSMDQLKERHKMLPFADEDFVAPMAGETLAAYQAVEAALVDHRDRWLELMSVWESAQELLENEGITKGNSVTAIKMLSDAKVQSLKSQLQQQCAAELDRLEAAHERVDALLQHNRQAADALVARIEAVGNLPLSTSAYDDDLEEAGEHAERAEQLRDADPLLAELALRQSEQSLRLLNDLVEAVHQQWSRAAELQQRREAAARLVAQRRSEGLLLAEPAGDPDPLLAEAASDYQGAVDALDRAEPTPAQQQLDDAHALLDDVDRQVATQWRFHQSRDQWLHQQREAVRDLMSRRRTVRSELEKLEQRHHPDAWQLVRDAGDELDTLIDAIEQLVSEAETESGPARQHYLRAQQLLDEAERTRPTAQQLADSVSQRLAELEEAASQCRSRWTQQGDESRRIERVLQTSIADRPQSNRRYQQVQRTLQAVQDELDQPRANWPAIQRQLDDVERDLQTVDRMVQQDLRLAEQADAEIREARQEVRRCQSFYQTGVSAQTGQAEGDLRSAEQARQRQDYEQAIQLANAAEQTARAALESARRQAEQRQREISRKRNQEAAMQVASVLAAAAATAASHFGSRRRRR